MARGFARLRERNQLTLPQAVVEKMGLSLGDLVEFAVTDQGAVELRPAKIVTQGTPEAQREEEEAKEDIRQGRYSVLANLDEFQQHVDRVRKGKYSPASQKAPPAAGDPVERHFEFLLPNGQEVKVKLPAFTGEIALKDQSVPAAQVGGEDSYGIMVVDIGSRTSDIAVISGSGIVYSRSVRMAGTQMDEAIVNYLKRKYNLLIGERTAEQIKMEIGSALQLDEPLTMEIKGRDLIEGVPKTITVDDGEIREALSECVSTIIRAIRMALERTPELSDEIRGRGMALTGGGALLKNLEKRIREETGVPVMLIARRSGAVGHLTGEQRQEVEAIVLSVLKKSQSPATGSRSILPGHADRLEQR
jgi:bifunctional DNA-binding transcriptional regulator/antitoxin component of YhaV-PrlF toxin-antitoxin module